MNDFVELQSIDLQQAEVLDSNTVPEEVEVSSMFLVFAGPE